MRLLLIILFVITSIVLHAQDKGFAFGKVTIPELNMKVYQADTSARAVVLDEFGETYFENDNDYNMMYEYHVLIKILKEEGKDKGDFTIPLYKNKTGEVKLLSWEASTFNLSGSASVKESKVDKSSVFKEKYSDNYDIVKLALPNVRVGSVIEIKYKIESSFINIHQWLFQDDIPKIRSEYWVKIPGIYVFNVSLKGYMKLTKNVATVETNCFYVRENFRADCSFSKYAMQNIPAFIEEEYMTAKSNFISSINFELSERTNSDGVVKRITRTWKDVENELRTADYFGKQLRKASGIKDEKLKSLIGKETDPLNKASIIESHLKKNFIWNERNAYWSDDVKKAYEEGKGSSGDINLALIGTLQAYDIEADPIMLSTRSNGLVTELYPVITDFNYVIARVKIGETIYFLDATDPFLPFGSLPVRCINGKGRLISKTESEWVVLRPGEKQKRTVTYDLKLTPQGNFKGKVLIQSTGYFARNVRKKVQSARNLEDYLKEFEKDNSSTCTNYTSENRDELAKPMIEKFDIEIPGFDNVQAPILYFNPFFDKYEKNPLVSRERLSICF